MSTGRPVTRLVITAPSGLTAEQIAYLDYGVIWGPWAIVSTSFTRFVLVRRHPHPSEISDTELRWLTAYLVGIGCQVDPERDSPT